MIPAIVVDGLCCCLRILVVAQHHIGTLGEDFSRNILWVWRINLHLHVVGSLSAGTLCEGVPVAIADDGCALSSTVAHSIGEFDALEELFHLLIECCASDDDLVHASSEGLEHLLANHLAYLLGDDRHLEQQSHTVVLYLWEYLLADNLFDNEGHGNHNDGLDFCQCLCNDGRRGDTVQVVHVTPMEELKDKFECHAVHVSHGQHRDHLVAGVNLFAEHVASEVIVRPQGAIGKHHTFGEARCAAGVVDHC